MEELRVPLAAANRALQRRVDNGAKIKHCGYRAVDCALRTKFNGGVIVLEGVAGMGKSYLRSKVNECSAFTAQSMDYDTILDEIQDGDLRDLFTYKYSSTLVNAQYFAYVNERVKEAIFSTTQMEYPVLFLDRGTASSMIYDVINLSTGIYDEHVARCEYVKKEVKKMMVTYKATAPEENAEFVEISGTRDFDSRVKGMHKYVFIPNDATLHADRLVERHNPLDMAAAERCGSMVAYVYLQRFAWEAFGQETNYEAVYLDPLEYAWDWYMEKFCDVPGGRPPSPADTVRVIVQEALCEPVFASRGSAAFDLKADKAGHINIGERKKIGCGISMDLPEGTVGLIKERSGLAMLWGLEIKGGVIDSDYIGTIKAIIKNDGKEVFHYMKGTSIAQMVIVSHIGHASVTVTYSPWHTVGATTEVVKEVRGTRGFGDIPTDRHRSRSPVN